MARRTSPANSPGPAIPWLASATAASQTRSTGPSPAWAAKSSGLSTETICLTPGAAAAVLEAFARHPEVDLVYGEVEWIDADGAQTGRHKGDISTLEELLDVYTVWFGSRQWVQPEVFFRRSLWEKAGPFNTGYDLAFDYAFWVQCMLGRGACAAGSASAGPIPAARGAEVRQRRQGRRGNARDRPQGARSLPAHLAASPRPYHRPDQLRHVPPCAAAQAFLRKGPLPESLLAALARRPPAPARFNSHGRLASARDMTPGSSGIRFGGTGNGGSRPHGTSAS